MDYGKTERIYKMVVCEWTFRINPALILTKPVVWNKSGNNSYFGQALSRDGAWFESYGSGLGEY